MFEKAKEWLQKSSWKGLIIAYLFVFASIFVLILSIIEAASIPSTLQDLPSFVKSRLFIHLVLTSLISPYVILGLEVIRRIASSSTQTQDNKTRATLRTSELAAISPYFFERIGVHAVILEGDGIYEYDDSIPAKVRVRWNPDLYDLSKLPSEELQKLCAKVRDDKIRTAQEQNRTLYNGLLARIVDYTPIRDEREGFRGLDIRLRQTDYHTYLATNHAITSTFAEEVKRSDLLKAERQSATNLRDSVLANAIAVTLNVITTESDGTHRLIVQKRNLTKVAHGFRYKWTASAAGMVNMPDDTSTTLPNPIFAAAIREIKQEIGLEVKADQVVFLGLVRDTDFFEVSFVGEVRVQQGYRTILGDIEDHFEADRFEAVRFTPYDVAEFLRQKGTEDLNGEPKPKSHRAQVAKGVQTYAPVSLAGICMSLVHEYGSARKVEDAFTK